MACPNAKSPFDASLNRCVLNSNSNEKISLAKTSYLLNITVVGVPCRTTHSPDNIHTPGLCVPKNLTNLLRITTDHNFVTRTDRLLAFAVFLVPFVPALLNKNGLTLGLALEDVLLLPGHGRKHQFLLKDRLLGIG